MSPAEQPFRPSTHRTHLLPAKSTKISGGGLPPAAGGPPAGGANPRRLLVVDDDPQMAALVAKMGVHIGCRCTTASDALDALFYLNQSHHDVVITDFDMPFIDGVQLADQIRSRFHHTKVILMTGQWEADIRSRMAGCTSVDRLIVKPFNLNAMRDTLEAVCGSQSIDSRP